MLKSFTRSEEIEMAIKKLIEVALPLERINEESEREKHITQGHPATFHLWWARRPLVTARAIIWSSLVDDPSSHPEIFPTEEAQINERKRLFRILEQLVVWENSNNYKVLEAAKNEILKYNNGIMPKLLDPFAGGGTIPIEGQRLGLESYAYDLNPVAVTINKAMLEIPSVFRDRPSINPVSRALIGGTERNYGSEGIKNDVAYYAKLLKKAANEKVGSLYPEYFDKRTDKSYVVNTWIWTRTVKCKNPACLCEIPLVRSFTLSKKKQTIWAEPIYDTSDNDTRFFMSVKLDNTRVIRDLQKYLDEVITHLSTVDNCEVELMLEVSAQAADGFPQGTVRTVSENCRTLRVDNFGFEK